MDLFGRVHGGFERCPPFAVCRLSIPHTFLLILVPNFQHELLESRDDIGHLGMRSGLLSGKVWQSGEGIAPLAASLFTSKNACRLFSIALLHFRVTYQHLEEAARWVC